MNRKDDFFIGWQGDLPSPKRRAFIAGSAGLVVAAASTGVLMARNKPAPGAGIWDQGMQLSLYGRLLPLPYPHLLTEDLSEEARTIYLVGAGKTALDLARDYFTGPARVTGTMISRGTQAMLAVTDAVPADALRRTSPRPVPAINLGETIMTGEILDAKCWFGAMRPGYGKTHKACAALCARGGLPLAFCPTGQCGDAIDAPLFLDEAGNPHPRDIFPFLADPVAVKGRRVRIGDREELRVARKDIRRL